MPGLWAGVSGVIEDGEDPKLRAVSEIREELGIPEEGLELLNSIPPVVVGSSRYRGRTWLLHPFLFRVNGVAVRLNWENAEYRWVRKGDLPKYETVPCLGVILSCLLLRGCQIPASL